MQMKRKAVSRKHIPAVFRSMKARKKKALRMIQRKKRLPDQLLTRWKKLQRMVMKKSLKIRKQLLAKTLRLKKQLRKNSEENEGDEAVSEEALQEDGSLQKDDSAYEEVEETAAPYGTEAASAADPSLSEDDEWLYSKPRRFAKKPANEQKN